MKKRIGFFCYLFLLLVTAFHSSCGTDKSGKKANYGEKTIELIEIVENYPKIKSMLIASIKKAKEINPDKNTNPVQSLEEYYEFISRAEMSMPWNLINIRENPKLYDDIIQSICYFYFLNDQPLPELEAKGYFNNSLQYVEPYSSWLVSFCKSWGNYLDSEDSWNENYYQLALEDDKFGLKNNWYEDPSNWKTFNQFFSRYLKSPDKRPITAPDDNSIVVSPVDSEPQGVWEIDSNSNLTLKQGVAIKSGTLNSIEKLIGENSEYEHEFANGTFTHSFLNVHDYHRYHFPLSGIVKEVRIIPGLNAVGALIAWDSINNRYVFDPSNVGWQSVETRGCIILETEESGLVALLPIGMAQIGSVNFEENIKEGMQVNKGDMLGYFLFGGSDFIMIFQEKAGFILDAPKKQGNSQSYKHLLMGERIGHLNGIYPRVSPEP
jgi:phosphatidylserine decarboxylase precursor